MYLCNQLSADNATCLQWVEYTPPNTLYDQLAALANLPWSDVTAIWLQIVMLFATAYVFKHLPFFIRRR